MTRRRRRLVLALGAVVVGLAVARRLGATRSPHRSATGTQRVVGSLDTWPEVPRAPDAVR